MHENLSPRTLHYYNENLQPFIARERSGYHSRSSASVALERSCRALTVFFRLAPRMSFVPLTRRALRADLSPQAGRGGRGTVGA